ncbi:MAG: hypothetical protein H6606_05770 [Flavobacteriales bacterium]|nr:hypothetical protein [Flavobacteriales bacterium]
MEYFGRRIRLLEEMLSEYNGPGPFHLFLKQFFKKHPECGSKDRKALREMAYVYWRISCVLKAGTLEERLRDGFEILKEPMRDAGEDLPEQLRKLTDTSLDREKFAQFDDFLTERINKADWLVSRMQEPRLWLRIRGESDSVRKYFHSNTIGFVEPFEGCFGVENGTDLRNMPAGLFKRIEVQDIASQRASGLIQVDHGARVWDCCAGSGGKSLVLLDRGIQMDLYVSDKRQSILHNLSQRFRSAGYSNYAQCTCDLSRSAPGSFQKDASKLSVGSEYFDHIICDVPCSGSGTWGRTPESWTTFKSGEIGRYAQLQTSILHRVWPFLKPGGTVWYLTCSVFEAENEMVLIGFLEANKECEFVFDTYCNELAQGGDSLYLARLLKKSG